jgi:hypothetical protein
MSAIATGRPADRGKTDFDVMTFAGAAPGKR